jgi:hypothetical protein
MNSRLAKNIIALLLVAMGFLSFKLYRVDQEKQTLLNEYTALKTQEETQRREAEEALRAEEERNKAEQVRAAAEAEQRRKKVEQERQRQEQARREKLEKEQQKKGGEQRRLAAEEERRRQALPGKGKPGKGQGKAAPGARQQGSSREQEQAVRRRTITIRTRVSVSDATQVAIARVHAGDRVLVRVRRFDGVHYPLWAGLGPVVRKNRNEYPEAPLGIPRLLSVRIKDQDQFTISRQLNRMPPYRFNAETEGGAVLYLGTGLVPRPSPVERMPGRNRGIFEIEIDIQPQNRWHLLPESLI